MPPGPNCISAMDVRYMTVLIESGKSFDQTGLYEECLQTLNAIYYFLTFKATGAKDSNRVYMGVCVPDTCTESDISDEIDQIFEAGKIPLQVYSITTPSTYEYPKDWLFWLTVSWLGLLAFLFVAATIIKAFMKKRSNKLVNCFALQQNVKIFAARESSLTFFNGVRCVCLFWIVFGHSVTIRVIDSANWITLENQFSKAIAMIPLGAFFAVDIFFYLGGFLLGYVFFTQLKRNNVLIYIMAMVHRLLRFYPSYITAILIWYQIFPHSGTGPFWPQVQRFVEPCHGMWKNILFIDNMWETFSCLPWAWYLSNDIQLFAVCLLMIGLYTKFPRTALITMGLMVLGSITYNFVESYKEKYIVVAHISDIFFKFNPYFFKLYVKPWSRCPPYLIGLIMGIQYFEFFKYNNEHKKAVENGEEEDFVNNARKPLLIKVKLVLEAKAWLRYIMYIGSLAIVLFLVFIPRTRQLGHEWTQTEHSLYLSLSKLVFTLAVAILLLPATVGIKDIVTTVFDTRFFSIIAKISFWSYLIHYIVIMRNSYNLKQSEYFTFFEVFQQYLTDLGITLFLGFVFTMVVEAPFVKLERFIFKRGGGVQKAKSSKEPRQTTQQPLIHRANTTPA